VRQNLEKRPHSTLSSQLSAADRRLPEHDAPATAAFGRAFTRYAAGLQRYARRFVRSQDTAEDLVQDVFWRVWRRWRQLEAGDNLRAYLYTATRTRALDHLASDAADAKRRDRYVSDSHPPDEISQLTTEQISAAIQAVLETLPPRQREVAVLRLHHQMSTAAIATRLRISPRTVEVHIARATRALRTQLPSLLDRP
jgi:RNA polymerase sigma-70 factor (ECF subfamily)